MPIEAKTLSGTTPGSDRRPSEVEALKQLNQWRASEPDARIINIETLLVVLGSTSTKSFDGFRVWHEV